MIYVPRVLTFDAERWSGDNFPTVKKLLVEYGCSHVARIFNGLLTFTQDDYEYFVDQGEWILFDPSETNPLPQSMDWGAFEMTYKPC